MPAERRRGFGVILGCALVLVASAPPPGAVGARAEDGSAALLRQGAPPHVTLIGDSVADALRTPPGPTIAGQGIDLDLVVEPCRRTEGPGCYAEGYTTPPSAIDVINQLGSSVGPTLVMMTGYDDFEDQFQQDIADLLKTAEGVGVTRIVWLNLYESRMSYQDMNGMLAAAAAQDPHLTILDWNAYARSHPDWFQSDGVHLTPDGEIALATFIHSSLVTLGIAQQPPPAPTTTSSTTGTTTTTPAKAKTGPLAIVTSALPPARADRPYQASLKARGGKPPYRWVRIKPLPHGIELAADGLVAGIPRTGTGSFELYLKVTDANGRHATRRVLLRVGQ
jgi:hypothetical protein